MVGKAGTYWGTKKEPPLQTKKGKNKTKRQLGISRSVDKIERNGSRRGETNVCKVFGGGGGPAHQKSRLKGEIAETYSKAGKFQKRGKTGKKEACANPKLKKRWAQNKHLGGLKEG